MKKESLIIRGLVNVSQNLKMTSELTLSKTEKHDFFCIK